MEIKKTKRGFEVDGIPFDSKEVAEKYISSLRSQKKADLNWLDEKIDYSFDPDERNPSFKVFIEKIAQAQELSIKQISDKIGVTRQTLYNWMDAKVIPDPGSLDKICSAFQVSRQEVTLATIDNFVLAYPELIQSILLDVQDCDVLLGSVDQIKIEIQQKAHLRSVLNKVKSIQGILTHQKRPKQA